MRTLAVVVLLCACGGVHQEPPTPPPHGMLIGPDPVTHVVLKATAAFGVLPDLSIVGTYEITEPDGTRHHGTARGTLVPLDNLRPCYIILDGERRQLVAVGQSVCSADRIVGEISGLSDIDEQFKFAPFEWNR